MKTDVMKMSKEKFTWIASYPKSGNTWLRMMINSYKQNGHLDINESLATTGDNMESYTHIVSPLPFDHLGLRGKLLIRPAALLAQMVSCTMRPIFIKTHHVNGAVEGLPPLIPYDLTERAIYIVRDPRDIVTSLSKHIEKSVEETIDNMNNPGYGLSSTGTIPHLLNTWSEHVNSWTGVKYRYPVLLVKYEDMMENPSKELIRVLEFCGIDPDLDVVNKSVESCEINKLRKQEQDKGFLEKKKQEIFFYKGGSRWREELDRKIIRKIEKDHGLMMTKLGYSLEYVKKVA